MANAHEHGEGPDHGNVTSPTTSGGADLGNNVTSPGTVGTDQGNVTNTTTTGGADQGNATQSNGKCIEDCMGICMKLQNAGLDICKDACCRACNQLKSRGGSSPLMKK